MRVIGFSVGHDKGAVLIQDGEVLIGISQERLTRIKRDGAYSNGTIPFECINYCLSEHGLTYNDINFFVYSTTELTDDINEQFIRNNIDISNKLEFIPHHLAHAYSTFFSSGFEESSVVVADASGSILTTTNKLPNWYPNVNKEELNPNEDWTEGISIYKFTKNGYEEVYKKWIKFPVPVGTGENTSLGMLYSTGCLQLIFEPKENVWPAGKLMGLASYANPEIVKDIPSNVLMINDDIFISNMNIYPRVTYQTDFNSRACVAGAYQRDQEAASLILAKFAKEKTNSKNICTAGGSFLNCNSNEKIIESKLFENCFFVPPSDDSGIPLGCAWYAYQQISDIGETKMINPYFGKTYKRNDIINTLNEFKITNFIEFDDFNKLIDYVSFELTQNRVIGWFQGGSEIGPRALGNRSILASPIPSWMTGHINSDIKRREWYRPFAPAVMHEHQDDIFESNYYSPYMLITTKVNEEWRKKIPAVTHIDNSARHQSVTLDTNPKFYKLIDSFYQRTGVPVLLNTSFNGPNEPIVETPTDAINTFLNINLNILVIDNFLIRGK
jgi:carbamoyltransferase